MASISGKQGQAWLSVNSATNTAVIGWTQRTTSCGIVPEIVFPRPGEAR